jgi:hypothetical protein
MIITKYMDYYLKSLNNLKDSKIMYTLKDKYLKDNMIYQYNFKDVIEFEKDVHLNFKYYLKKIKNLDYYKHNIIVIYYPGIYSIHKQVITNPNFYNSKNLKIPYNIKYIFIAYLYRPIYELTYTLNTQIIKIKN